MKAPLTEAIAGSSSLCVTRSKSNPGPPIGTAGIRFLATYCKRFLFKASPSPSCCPNLGINVLDASRGRHIPRLGQGGVDATSRKCRGASSLERTGRLVQLPINRQLDRTAPSAPLRRLRTFSYWRSHPALTKAGNMPLANGSVASSMFAQEDRSSANWTGKINKTGPASAPSESTPLIKEIGCPN